ncbi:hypothetical protein QF049_001063 [Paenibacillus sp. W4I10]|uniref:hypothetical protein n=1 Tax=Paenibacillus sp. W4I10 TaxID=3042298 RepID=UPI002784FE73|nr:hypothetical protein [Paenibacillus sp. W4I10]MDQ0719802.1 hypothetical protein [Paenibacillus sp. W4I10]
MSDMMIRKTQGEYPLDIVVLDETVHFDKRGIAEVDEIIGEVLLSIPGYVECKPKASDLEEGKGAQEPGKEKKESAKGKQAPSSASQPPADTPAATE